MTQQRAQVLSGTIGMVATGVVIAGGIWIGISMWAGAPSVAVLWFLGLTILTVVAYVATVALAVRLVSVIGPHGRNHPTVTSRGRSSRARR